MSIALNSHTISVVIPVFNEEKNIRELYSKINTVLPSLNLPYEIIFVDDGSKDGTYEELKDIQTKDVYIKIVKLAKNYGQSYAFLAGFEFVKGDIVITMDGDLQNDPCEIKRFLIKIEGGFDFISGWRYNRKDTFLRKLISAFANWFIGIRSGIRLHDYGCAFTAVKKELIERLKSYGASARFTKPLIARLASSIFEVKVSHHPRRYDVSKYNLFRIITLGLDFFLNFDGEPKKIKKLPFIIEEIIGG